MGTNSPHSPLSPFDPETFVRRMIPLARHEDDIISTVQPSPDGNAKVAQDVMGWVDLHQNASGLWCGRDSTRYQDKVYYREDATVPEYLSRIEAAWDVVIRLLSLGLFVQVTHRGWYAECQILHGEEPILVMYAETPPLAICMAAASYIEKFGTLGGLEEFLTDPEE